MFVPSFLIGTFNARQFSQDGQSLPRLHTVLLACSNHGIIPSTGLLHSTMQLNLLLFILALPALSCAAPTSTPGSITSPAHGTVVMPGQPFDFVYETRADYSCSSFNYTVLLFTSLPKAFSPTDAFSTGHFFGRFAEPNYPGNPNPPNPPPAQLVMPDFSKNPGGFGVGAPDSNATVYLAVLEEFATGVPSVGLRMSLAINPIIYNGTSSHRFEMKR